MLGRLSLRARLVLGVIVLAAAGLAIANVATYAALRSFLVERTDQSLLDAQRGIGGGMHRGRGCPDGDRAPPGAQPGDYIELRTGEGEVLCSSQVSSFVGEERAPPDLPERLAAPSPGSARFFTVSAADAGGRYRVSTALERDTGFLLVVATPLDDVDATLRRLALVALLVTGMVLVALGALGLWVVRLGLRPLDDIGATAAAIAGGDLSRRVERAEPGTEVGRLGTALNAMLAQIEAAFRAREASERKLRRFVADASHELRTPLAAVRAYAELFTRGADRRPEDLARAMDGIGRESERMSLLVDDLLLLARLDEGRPLAREPVALEQVVSEAVETARTVEPERPIDLTADRTTVVGDRDRLRQIVDNLLGNVRAHTPARTPVSVRVGRSNGQAFVEVADSGPGMRSEDAERVFERFYRADRSRSRASGGVGLGLAIVSAVAEAHGGTVTATSTPGEGATFRITLPFAEPGANGRPDPAGGEDAAGDHAEGDPG